jgi:hypothetical protein
MLCGRSTYIGMKPLLCLHISKVIIYIFDISNSEYNNPLVEDRRIGYSDANRKNTI